MPTKKYIRFIDSDYSTLFHLPDGGRVRITYPDGRQLDRVCRFLDECHTQVGNSIYHIHEFAEQMERGGAKYEPLDYIREPEFYRRYFFAAVGTSKGPAYYIIDETETHGFAFAPKGARKGQKYCVFKILETTPGRKQIGSVIHWGGTLRDIRPQDRGFDAKKMDSRICLYVNPPDKLRCYLSPTHSPEWTRALSYAAQISTLSNIATK